MAVQKLKIVGGSTMVTISPAMMAEVGLKPKVSVDVSVEDGRIVITNVRRPRYTLEELLAKCDPTKPFSDAEREWMSDKPAGREVL